MDIALCYESVLPARGGAETYIGDLARRLARHPVAGWWWQAKDLAQLLYSSDVAGVTARDRVRFWKLYRTGWPGRAPGNWLLPLVRWKWRLYQRHERRRAGK